MSIQPGKGPFDEQNAFRDLALKVENRQFWVPRQTLAAYSPVFEKMLYGEFAESKQDVIPLPGKKASEIEEILKYLIPHPNLKPINLSTDLSNIDQILGFAEEYQIEYLRSRAEEVLIGQLKGSGRGDEKMLQILVISSKYRLIDLLKESIKRCGTEFELIPLQSIFGNLHDKVIICLMLYKNLTPPDQKCKYFYKAGAASYCDSGCPKRDSYGYSSTPQKSMTCMYCGVSRCGNCLINGKLQDVICNGKLSVVDKSVNTLLKRF